jgi:hypothetical protein
MEKARALLEDGSLGNCVLYKNGTIHASRGKGISPMLEFLAAGIDMKGFSAADTVAGKALALLFVFAGIQHVYAGIISSGAVEIFDKYNVRCVYGMLTEQIKNRTGTDICPMERAVEGIDEPEEAVRVIVKAYENMRKS